MTTRNPFRLVRVGAVSRLTLGTPDGELFEVDLTRWEIAG